MIIADIDANNFEGGRKVAGRLATAASEILTNTTEVQVVASSDSESSRTISVENSSDVEMDDNLTNNNDNKRAGAVEVFCGRARLSKELCSAGFEAVGVDYLANKDKPISASTMIDLRTLWGQRELKKLIKDINARLVWLAAPCGPASRSRR